MALKSNCLKTQPNRWIFLLAIVFVALWISLAVIHTGRQPSPSESVLLRGDSSGEGPPTDHEASPGPSSTHEEGGGKGTLKLEFQASSSSDDGAAAPTTPTFKILQIADLHLGEGSWTDWGPKQDAKTIRVMDSMILAEQPNLIVLSGDQISSEYVNENATAYYQNLGEKLSVYGIPWALVFGNHDDAPLEKDGLSSTKKKSKTRTPAKTSRQQLLAVDQKFPLSLTQSTPGMFGSSNYQLDIHYPSTWSSSLKDDDDDVAVQLFFLDSGGGSLRPRVGQKQIEWFQKTHKPSLPGAIVFQHMPTSDFVYDGRICMGGLHDNGNDDIGFDPIPHDSGLVQTLQDASNVQFLAVGHNHGNDYCCPTTTTTDDDGGSRDTTNLHLCFGRRSGYGGYGDWDQGARVYELQLVEGSDSKETSLKWKSWVRMEDQTIVDNYDSYSS